MSRMWWRRWRAIDEDRERLGVSFSWPRDTDLTRVFRGARRNAPEIAMREMAASPSQPDAGPLPVETTASVAPRPQSNAADWIERAQPGSTPVLGGIVGTQDADGSSVVWSDGSAMYGHGETPGAAMRDYAESRANLPAVEGGRWPSMPMRELSNDNYDRVWVAQGDHVEAMGVGDTPQEAAIEYARAVADLLRPVGGPDAFDSKAQIREQQRACRSDCGDGPCGCAWEEWSR